MPSEIFNMETKLKLYRLHRTADTRWWDIELRQDIVRYCKCIYAVAIWLLVWLTYWWVSIYTAQYFIFDLLISNDIAMGLVMPYWTENSWRN